jgi:hypothetical protein
MKWLVCMMESRYVFCEVQSEFYMDFRLILVFKLVTDFDRHVTRVCAEVVCCGPE